MLSLLIASGADAQGKEGLIALKAAARAGHAEIVRLLIAAGAKLSVEGDTSEPVLCAAVRSRNSDMIRQLISAGADINPKDSIGRTALHWASFLRWEEAVKLLIAAGADVNAKDVYGDVPLSTWSCFHGTPRSGTPPVGLSISTLRTGCGS